MRSPAWQLYRPFHGFDAAFANVDQAAAKGVRAAPAARNSHKLDAFQFLGNRRIDQQMIADRLETEQAAQQQQRRTGSPSLRAAGGGVLDGEPGFIPRVAGKGLGQTMVEKVGRLQYAKRNPGRFAAVA